MFGNVEVVKVEVVEDEVVDDGVVEGDVVRGEVVEGEVVGDEVLEDEVLEDEVVDEEVVESWLVFEICPIIILTSTSTGSPSSPKVTSVSKITLVVESCASSGVHACSSSKAPWQRPLASCELG